MVEVMKIMVTSFKRSHHALPHSVPPTLQQATTHQCPPNAPGHSQASLGQSLLGVLLLSPGSSAHKVLFVLSQCLFPQSCVSSGGSVVG